MESIKCTVDVPIEAMFAPELVHEFLCWLALEHPEDLIKCAIEEIAFEENTFVTALRKELDRLEVNTLNQLKFIVDAELVKRDPNLKEMNDEV